MTIPILRFRRMLATLLLAIGATVVVSEGQVGAAEAPVGLGTAVSFAVLGGSTVTNTGPSVISGDLGVHPGTAVVGFPPGTVNNGSIHAADAKAAQAQADLTTAYNDAAGRSPTATVTADLAGQTLLPGVYRGPTLALNGTLTLDALGDPSAVFIFQAGSTLITGSASAVSLVNGASPCNVYWQVGSSATLGTNSVFAGTIMALTSVTANTGASAAGRLLARNGATTLDTNNVNLGNCAAGATTTTTSATNTTTTAATTTTAPATGTTSTPAESTTTTTPLTTVVSLPTGGTTGTAGTAGARTTRGTAAGTGRSGASRGTTAASTGRGTATGGGGGGSATATGRTTALADTGSQLTGTAIAGMLALLLGAMLLLMSRTSPAPEPVRRYRC